MFKKILLACVLSGTMAYPALAQMSSDDMSCADFMAMDASAQMDAIHAMSSGGMMAEGDNMAGEDNMMAGGDNMAGDDNMMAGNDNMAGEDNMMAGDDTMAGEVTVEAVAKACTGDPKMMLHDAMMQAEAN
jgi:hypothetical protein